MRMDRRTGLLAGFAMPELEDFWRQIDVVKMSGTAGSTKKRTSFALYDTSTPLWTFYSTGAEIRIDKYKNNTGTLLYSIGTPTLNISEDSTTEATIVSTDANNYAYTILAFRCPNYNERIVDKRLQTLAVTVEGSRNASSTGSVSMNHAAAANTLYMQFIALQNSPYGYWSICNGSSPLVAIKRANGEAGDTFPFWYQSSTTKYYLSRSGTASFNTYGGGIYSVAEA